MINRHGIVHESVQNVLEEIGVGKEGGKVNPANNARFVAEGALKAAGLVTEAKDPTERMKPDETDGEPNCSTKSSMGTSTTVNTDPKNTDTKVDVDASAVEEGKKDLPDFIKDKMKDKDDDDDKDDKKKSKKDDDDDDDDDDKDDKKKSKKSKKDDDDKDDKKEKCDEQAVAASEAFYEGLGHPVGFVIYEDDSAEVFGLTTEELAPFGGNPPAISPKYAKAAKSGGDKTKGSVGELMLYSTKEMNKQVAKLLTGTALKACGWKPGVKGTGHGTLVMGGKAK